MQLRYSTPTINKQVIPSDRLFSAAPQQGDYILSVEGQDQHGARFEAWTYPLDGSRLNNSFDELSILFSEDVLITSLQASDLTINGQAATSFEIYNSRDVLFAFSTPF